MFMELPKPEDISDYSIYLDYLDNTNQKVDAITEKDNDDNLFKL